MRTDEDVQAALSCYREGRIGEAEQLCLNVLRRRADNATATHLLGMIAQRAGRLDEALRLMGRSVELAPAAPSFRSNLAGLLGRMGRSQEAVTHLREAIRFSPEFPEAYNNLGVALEALARLDDAAAAYREAIRLKPDYPEPYNNLGNVLRKAGRIEEGMGLHRRALELRPGYANAMNNLGAACEQLGRVEEAMACYREAAALGPGCLYAHNNLLIANRYRAEENAQETFDAHLRWAKEHAEPLYASVRPHTNDRDPDRPLRVGYVSHDLRSHPVARFIEPVLENHDRSRFSVVCYANVRPDAVTARLRSKADEWHDVTGSSPLAIAEQVRRDRIDILVDLAGHTHNDQMLLFARQPAPVQVAYLGYSDTTGLRTVQYRLTDEHHDPPGVTDRYYTERLVRLPGCAWCYRPFDESPAVNPLPAIANGHVTFGMFNRPPKITPKMARLWAGVLAEVPGARLLVIVERDAEAYARGLLQSNGVSRERLEVAYRGTAAEYLHLYHRVDVALDTYPHNGHTTTCDAAWMGVPTVTLAGQSFISRMGVSVLSNLGLHDLIAETPEQYVRSAVALARDIERMMSLRSGLRRRMARSALGDGLRLARHIEREYRLMWQSWCNPTAF